LDWEQFSYDLETVSNGGSRHGPECREEGLSGLRGSSLSRAGADRAGVDFIFEVVKAHVAPSPRHPETLHYTGDGVFMVAGKITHRRSLFRPGML
jgi:hypothetical protein